MSEPPTTFRELGILSAGPFTPPETIRASLSTVRAIVEMFGGVFVVTLGVGLTALAGCWLPSPLNLLGVSAFFLAFASLIPLATQHDYHWIELDGDTIRAKHLHTGRLVERSVEDIASLASIVRPIKGVGTTVGKPWNAHVQGVEIRFRDGQTPLRVLRRGPPMSNAQRFIETLIHRMARRGEVDAQVGSFFGLSVLWSVYWKGETPGTPTLWTDAAKVCIGGVVLLPLIAGSILAVTGMHQQELLELASTPPQEITLAALIENGPGSNRHVTITHFTPGRPLVKPPRSLPPRALVPLFPQTDANAKPASVPGEMAVILRRDDIASEADAEHLLQPGRFTGLCSASRTNWSGTASETLTSLNPGSSLSSAWEITNLVAPLPGEAIYVLFAGSQVCFVVVIVGSLVLFWVFR